MIGGFRTDLSITGMIDGNFGNVSAGVLFIHILTEQSDSALQKRERIGASFLY